ncbi:MAG TPA: penicillin-binding transpeptidase domain-containing protein [Pseudomonadales bacterium]|nr:penicillin-binding transpeptidase domain-containing protein [Pseudomonadales bacterium]
MFAISRVHVVIACLFALAAGMSARIVLLHLFDKDFLQDQGDARTIRMERINAHRGMIRDREGKPLAISAPVISLWANPKELKDQAGIDQLALMFDVTPAEFRKKLERSEGKDFVYLRRHMPPPEAQKIMSLDVKGVYAEREYQRFYPAGEVAAHLVGYTDIDDNGQEGVELSFNNWLQGTPGKKKVLKNLYGDIVRDIKPMVEAKPGKSLDLSVDLRLQYLAYRELKSAVAYNKAHSGSIVMLDVQTGKVLAMVNAPSYNPNNRTNLDMSAVRNRAVTDVFEPGSTVKPFTIAVALESGKYQPDSTIDTSPGFVHIDGKTIPDPTNYGVLTLAGIIAKSSQVGVSKLALTLNPNDIWNMFQSVGFGQATGIGFPGERSGELPTHARWADIERATFAFGYGFLVTPLQLAAAYLTIADGGVKRDVSILNDTPVAQGVRVMDEHVAQEIRLMLQGVVKRGTGRRASIDGYTVAGKTGTVRKVSNGNYEDTSHLAFFAGMAPAINPRVVTVVMINDPKAGSYGGGSVAAPVFSRVVAGALRLLNVPPDDVSGAS